MHRSHEKKKEKEKNKDWSTIVSTCVTPLWISPDIPSVCFMIMYRSLNLHAPLMILPN